MSEYLLQKINSIFNINCEIIERIIYKSKHSIIQRYVYSIKQELSDSFIRLTLEEIPEETVGNKIIDLWTSSEIMIPIDDIFNDNLNYTCKKFEDVVRLNKDLYNTSKKYELFGESVKASLELQKFLTNIETIQILLGDIEIMFNGSPSKNQEYTRKLSQINSTLLDLKNDPDVYFGYIDYNMMRFPNENEVNINVGLSFSLKTIKDAIITLVEEFGENGGNILATINLSNDFVWTEIIELNNRDYSWIKITNNSTIVINRGGCAMNIVNSSIGPIISGSYHSSSTSGFIFRVDKNSSLIVKGATFTTGPANTKLFAVTDNSCFNAKDLNITGFTTAILTQGRSEIYMDSSVINGSYYSVNGSHSTVTMVDCTFGNLVGTNFNVQTCRVTATDCSFKNNRSVIVGNAHSNFLFTNCIVTCTTKSGKGFVMSGGSYAIVDGGDYRNDNNSNININIVADGPSTYIRLINSPLGGSSAINNAQMIST